MIDCLIDNITATGIGKPANREERPFRQESGGGWRQDEDRPLVEISTVFPSLLWHGWFGYRKDIRPVKTYYSVANLQPGHMSPT